MLSSNIVTRGLVPKRDISGKIIWDDNNYQEYSFGPESYSWVQDIQMASGTVIPDKTDVFRYYFDYINTTGFIKYAISFSCTWNVQTTELSALKGVSTTIVFNNNEIVKTAGGGEWDSLFLPYTHNYNVDFDEKNEIMLDEPQNFNITVKNCKGQISNYASRLLTNITCSYTLNFLKIRLIHPLYQRI